MKPAPRKMALDLARVRRNTVSGLMHPPARKLALTNEAPSRGGRIAAAGQGGQKLSSELSEGERRLLADFGLLIFECDRQRIDRARIADLPEREATCSRTSAFGVLDCDDQRFDRAAVAQLSEREGRLLAHVGGSYP